MKTKATSLYVIYGWLAIFSFIPLSLLFVASFLSRDDMHLVALPFTLKNYTLLWSPVFLTILFRSVSIAFLATLICLLIAYPFSYLLLKSKRQSILLLLIILPFWTSSLIRTYSLVAVLKVHGILNGLLLALHLIEKPIAFLYSNTAVLIGLVYNLFPFMVLPLFTHMERFDFKLIEAGKDLGASRWDIFYRIFLPNTLPGIVVGCLFVFLPAMTLFYISNVLGGARSILLGNLIQNQFLVVENWPQGAATSIILTVLLLFLLVLFRRQNKGGFI